MKIGKIIVILLGSITAINQAYIPAIDPYNALYWGISMANPIYNELQTARTALGLRISAENQKNAQEYANSQDGTSLDYRRYGGPAIIGSNIQNQKIKDAILAHEKGHIDHNHASKSALIDLTAPLMWSAAFTPIRYYIQQYKDSHPLTVQAASIIEPLIIAYLSKKYPYLNPIKTTASRYFETQADDAIPTELKPIAADYYERDMVTGKSVGIPRWYQLWKDPQHPHPIDRANRLRKQYHEEMSKRRS